MICCSVARELIRLFNYFISSWGDATTTMSIGWLFVEHVSEMCVVYYVISQGKWIPEQRSERLEGAMAMQAKSQVANRTGATGLTQLSRNMEGWVAKSLQNWPKWISTRPTNATETAFDPARRSVVLAQLRLCHLLPQKAAPA